MVVVLLESALHAAIFMRLDGVPGDSRDKDHAGWIEVESIQHSLAPPGLSISGPAANGLMAVTKSLDKASPALARGMALNTTFPEMELEFTREEEESLRFFHVKLKNVVIHYFRSEGHSDATSYELVSFLFEGLEWTYVEADSANRPLVNHKFFWDYLRGAGGTETEKVGFVVQATQSPGEGLQLKWQADAGRVYRLMGTADLGQPFQPIQDIPAGDSGNRTLVLPAVQSLQFFYLTELP